MKCENYRRRKFNSRMIHPGTNLRTWQGYREVQSGTEGFVRSFHRSGEDVRSRPMEGDLEIPAQERPLEDYIRNS